MYIACNWNFIEIAKLLLDIPNINVNIKSYDENPLSTACHHKYLEIVKLLLSHPKINVNIKNSIGKTVLHKACDDEYIEVIKLLLSHPKINVNIKNGMGRTILLDILYLRTYYDRKKVVTEIAKLLLSHPKIDINTENEWEKNPLYCSLENQYIDIALILLNNSKIKIDDNHKYLDLAILNSNIEIVSILINKYKLNNVSKDTLLNLVLMSDSSPIDMIDMIKLILNDPNLSNKIKLNYKNDYGTLLHIISERGGHIELLKLLLSHPKINVNIKDGMGRTPLHLACKNNSLEKVQLFLTHSKIKIDFDYNDPDNYTEDDLVIMDEDNTVNIKIRNILKSKVNVKRNKSLLKILDTIED